MLDWLTADVINVAGIVLQLVGVTIAILGVRRLHRDLTEWSMSGVVRKSLVEQWRSWRTRKHVTGVSGAKTTIVVADGIGITSGHADDAMPDDPAGQISYLHRKVLGLEDRIRVVSESSERSHALLRSEANATSERLGEEIAEVEVAVADIRAAVGGGPSGEGLRLAAGGLALTLVGLALTLFAAV